MLGFYGTTEEKKTSTGKVKKSTSMSPLKFMRRSTSDRRVNHDPDYEEVAPVKILLKHTPDGRGDGVHCEVCGSAQAAVKCDNCSGQVFCAACDDVFHKHPRRTAHVRRAMDGVRPPLPPKSTEGPLTQGSVPPPQPPPRRNKRSFLGGRKDQSVSGSLMNLSHDSSSRQHSIMKSTSEDGGGPVSQGRTIMGSLRRFMGNRPLPPTPVASSHSGRSEHSNAHQTNLIRSLTSPDLANEELDGPSMAVAIPETVVDISSTSSSVAPNNKYRAPPPPQQLPHAPLTPNRAPQHAGGPQYPALMPSRSQSTTSAAAVPPQRKLSLQQGHLNGCGAKDERRQSMIDGGSWDASGRYRSQSVSDEQWKQLLAAQGHAFQPSVSAAHHAPLPDPQIGRSRFNSGTGSIGSNARMSSSAGSHRGMTSSTSVCDLNTLSTQPSLHPQFHQHQQQMMHSHHVNGMHQSGSFQQLNMVPYNGGMMWTSPCDMCHTSPMYPHPHHQLPNQGMKRTASNLSMNISSASSDVTGYNWQPHMHHHVPPMYPGYYPAPPPPHMIQGSVQSSSISIPDSMAAFSKVSSSPAPSVRSSSRRSQKTSKSRSFSTADLSRRTRSNHRTDSDETTSTSPSLDDDAGVSNKPGFPGGSLPWQCDHCTFINQAGSRVCGMCSKSHGSTSNHRSNRRGSEKRRNDRRYMTKRNDVDDDDDRDPSDYENDGKQNLPLSSRELRRDRSSKSSTTSRSKKKNRRRGGSSGSASDAVEELERQLADLKVNRGRGGSDYDGVASRLKERERERVSKRREGVSSRYRFRGKAASERSRTPGRRTPENVSPQASPQDDESPPDDDVFEVVEEKKHESNSNSNDRTLLASPGKNEEDTILVTECKKSKSDSRIKRSRSAKSSRASTPGPANDIQHAEVQVVEPTEILEFSKLEEPKQKEFLDIPKPKEKSPSPIRRQNSHDEISFANTLDDIATMGTNEVADIYGYLEERPLSALPVNVDDFHQFIPTAKYVEPISTYEEKKETAVLSEHECIGEDKANSSSVRVEEAHDEKVPVQNEKNKIPGELEQKLNLPILSETYNLLEETEAEELQELAVPEGSKHEQYADVEEVIAPYYHNDDKPNIEYASAIQITDMSSALETCEIEEAEEEEEEADGEEETPEDAPQEIEFTSNRGSLEDINIRRSSSRGSSVGMGSAHIERQFTPLSFSSSDAAFYSPADSPEESLSEKLRDRPHGSQSQTVIAVGEDELVTALESLKSNDELRSSRETIRSSSVDDLPYSEEVQEFSDAERNSSSSKHTRGRDGRESFAKSSSVNVSPDGVPAAPPPGVALVAEGYVSSDCYEGLSFQDAESGLLSDGATSSLYKSASEQMLQKSSRAAEYNLQMDNWKAQTLAGSSAVDEKRLTIEELITKRKQEAMRKEGLELVQVIREAEKAGFQAEDVSVALPLCGDKGPLEWLMDNWRHMVDTVRALASNYGKERNSIGTISEQEAKIALRAHKGNIWAAVTETVEQRQNKFMEVSTKGNFSRQEVALALERHDGDADAAYMELSSAVNTDAESDAGEYQNLYHSFESTIEELLARDQNPTFYEYFTAVDLDEDGDEYRDMEEEERSTSIADSDAEGGEEISANNQTPLPPPLTTLTSQPATSAKVPTNIQLIPSQPEASTSTDDRYQPLFDSTVQKIDINQHTETSTNSEMLYVRKEDVVVHPTKLPLYRAELKELIKGEPEKTTPAQTDYKKDVKQTTNLKVKGAVGETSTNDTIINKNVIQETVVLRKKKPEAEESHNVERISRSSITYEESSEDEEGESVSITTGRLSLTLSHSSDKEGHGDVTSAVVEKEEIKTQLSPKIKNSATKGNVAKLRKSDIRHIEQLEKESVETSSQQDSTTTSEVDPKNKSLKSKNLAVILEPPKKKATSIIGKAIAKAIARETSVKESVHEGSPPAYSTEESSRGSTPASFTIDSTPASSFMDSDGSTPRSTTPPSTATPRSTPDITEDNNQTMQAVDSSEDDDLLRSLDTIPEEEEISERTESGRLLSRSSARNLKLPFSATSVIQLPSIKTNVHQRPDSFKPSDVIPVKTVVETSTTDDASISTDYVHSRLNQQQDINVQGDDNDEDEDHEEEDSDSSTPHQAEEADDDEDNSLASVPQPDKDVTPPKLMPKEEEDLSVVHSDMVSNVSHSYYNVAGKKKSVGPSYYNQIAAEGLPADEKVIIDPNDYESMYSIKRDLDMLKESSSEVAEKINSMGTKTTKKGQGTKAKSTSLKKEAKSTTKQSDSVTKEDTEEPTNDTDSPSGPVSGAQLLAEENVNTVKRAPKNQRTSKSTNSQELSEDKAQDIETGATSVAEVESTSNREVNKGSMSKKASTKTKTSQTKHKSKKKSDSENSSSDGSKSYEKTLMPLDESQQTKKNVDKPDKKSESVGSSVETLESTSNSESKTNRLEPTVKPKVHQSPSGSTKSSLQIPRSSPSAFTSPVVPKAQKASARSTLARAQSSDDSEDEDPKDDVYAQRVRYESQRLLPDLLTKLEGLRGRDPAPEEVQELKQQITDLKKTLQSQLTDEESEGGQVTPVITVEAPSIQDNDDVEQVEAGVRPPSRSAGVDNIQYEQLRFDRTVRRLLAEGQAGSYEKAELAAHLLSLSFDEDDSICAAQECSSIYGALHFLQQECELCAEKYPMKKMVSMLYCTHRCCMDCARTYFTYQIKTKNIREMRCPFCNEPNLDSSEEPMTEYFNHLDILLKGIVDEETHELFQRKLRDLTLMSDPNFRWCNKCSSGFIANPRARKLICPDCKDVTCAHCRLPWEAQHEGISCDAFARWKQENDPEIQAQGVAKHLAENGITCPKCRFTYSLAKGGCMHFTCTECKYEFCSGCGQPFRQGAKCPVGPYCERLGLHAHHPRNCLFYLRDKDPPQLQQLLKENNVPFDVDPPDDVDDTDEGRRCQVAEQKETPEGLLDDVCGRAVLQGNAGLCRLHYIEYLVEKINKHHLDPVIIFDEADLRVCLRRNGKVVPIRRWESEKLYRDKLIKLIKEQLPL